MNVIKEQLESVKGRIENNTTTPNKVQRSTKHTYKTKDHSEYHILSSFMTYHRFETRLTRRMPQVEQELLTFPVHLSSPQVFWGVRLTRYLVVCVCFVDRCLSFCIFYFGHYVVCSFSIYGFWLPPFGIFNLFYTVEVIINKGKEVNTDIKNQNLNGEVRK